MVNSTFTSRFFRALVAMVALAGVPAVAAADGPSVSPPLIELGARAGATATLFGPAPMAGGSVTWHANRILSVEADAAVLPPVSLSVWSARLALYQVGVRGRLVRSRSGIDWFLTGGMSGAIAWSHLSDEPVMLFGRWNVNPGPRDDRVHFPPLMPTAGFGVLVPVGHYLAVRGDVKALLMPIGPASQATVGITVPLGRFGRQR